MKINSAGPIRAILTLAIWLFLSQTAAAAARPESLYPGMLDPSRAIKTAAQVTRTHYPNADAVDVDTHKWVQYNDDGTYVEWFEVYTKVLTEKGRRTLNAVSSAFTFPYNTTAFTLVEVIAPDGTVRPVDVAANSQITTEQSQVAANIYNPNDKVLRISIPELNVGDTLHYVLFDDFVKVRTPGTWSDYVTFEGIHPIKRSAVTIIAPKSNPLQRIALKSEIPGTVTHKKRQRGDFIVYKWIAKDIPQVVPEPDMPPLYTQVQRLLVSTIDSWQSISRWYWELSRPQIEKVTPEMRAVVENLTGGLDDPEKRIRALFQWVSQEIRYLGITVEKDSPGYEPHAVSLTFERRAGVCRDKAALLTAMLRLAGFEAYPALIMNGPQKDPEVPQPFFNHAITAVREADGTYRLMDSTDENTRQMFPTYLNNQSYLVARPEGDTLRTSPVESAEKNMMRIATRGRLDARGRMTATSTLSFNGINDNAYRGFFSRISPDEQRGFFEKIIKTAAPGARLTGYTLLPENMLDTDRTLTVNLVFETDDIRVVGKDTLMLELPWIGSHLGMVHFLLGETGLKKRKYPIQTRYACGVQETMELELHQAVGKLLSRPEYPAVENPGATWRRSLQIQDNRLLAENTFKLKLPRYSPDQYQALLETRSAMEAGNRKIIIFQPPPTEPKPAAETWASSFQADAVVLKEELEYNVIDTSRWTETRHAKIKVLTYAGQKKYSDLHFDYNPVWETVQVKQATVTAPSGRVTTVMPQEINIMDAKWVGNAPRYPAGKTMVLSLPGVEEGSVIEFTVVRRKTNRPFFSIGGPFFKYDMQAVNQDQRIDHQFFPANSVFRYTDPIRKKTIRLQIPNELKVKIHAADQGLGLENIWKQPPGPVITEKSGPWQNSTVYEFTAEYVAPVKPEKHLPPWYSFNPVLFVSAGNWKNFARRVDHVLQQAARPQSATIARADMLVTGLSGVEDRIRAIRDFVAQHIKPVGIGFGELPLDRVTPADRTLADGYGNTTDRAVLLSALLQAAGLRPEFVIAAPISRVADLQKPLRQYPAVEWLDTVLVRVKTAAGFVYLNDTSQYAVLGSTPSAGFPGLVPATGEIDIIQAAAANLNDHIDRSYKIQIWANGDAAIEKTTQYYGDAFTRFRKRFSEMSPEERRRHHQEEIAAVSQAARADGAYTTDYQTYPGIETFSVRVDDYAVRQGRYLYLKLPGIVPGIADAGRDHRESPLYREDFKRQTIYVEVLLPEGTDSIEALPPENIVFPVQRSGSIGLQTKTMTHFGGYDRRLRIRQDIRLDPAVVLPAEYPQLLEAQRILSHPRTRMVVLKMEP